MKRRLLRESKVFLSQPKLLKKHRSKSHLLQLEVGLLLHVASFLFFISAVEHRSINPNQKRSRRRKPQHLNPKRRKQNLLNALVQPAIEHFGFQAIILEPFAVLIARKSSKLNQITCLSWMRNSTPLMIRLKRNNPLRRKSKLHARNARQNFEFRLITEVPFDALRVQTSSQQLRAESSSMTPKSSLPP